MTQQPTQYDTGLDPRRAADALDLRTLRQRAMEQALTHQFQAGRLRGSDGDREFFRDVLVEIKFGSWCALEYADDTGPFAGDPRVLENVLPALEAAAEAFGDDGTVAQGDLNTAYFSLVPATEALRAVAGHVDQARHARLVERCAKLFDDGLKHINGTLDYCNPRALEAVSGFGLHALTGEARFRERAEQCLEALLARQYPCGAQPYQTAHWVWGRRPAQAYQLLSGTMMVRLAQQVDRPEVLDYVKRVLAFVATTTTRRGEVLTTTYEGLHKSDSRATAAWAWPVAADVEGSESLARAVYGYWLEPMRALFDDPARVDPAAWSEPGARAYLSPLFHAAMLGVEELPRADAFTPAEGVAALPDISTLIVHKPRLDLCATLLTGYSAWAQGDAGSVRLYAVTPELTDEPSYANAGTDAQREDWTQASEQIACHADGDRAELRGRSYTKWDMLDSERAGKPRDDRRVHARELEVSMTWEGDELVLDYHTTRNAHVEPVSTRLLFLLAVRPDDASAHLRIGTSMDQALPSAASEATYRLEAEPGPVTFAAPDGSAVQIGQQGGRAERIVIERPAQQQVSRVAGARKNKGVSSNLFPANEGCVRLTFEGPAVLDEGRFRIRFITA